MSWVISENGQLDSGGGIHESCVTESFILVMWDLWFRNWLDWHCCGVPALLFPCGHVEIFQVFLIWFQMCWLSMGLRFSNFGKVSLQWINIRNSQMRFEKGKKEYTEKEKVVPKDKNKRWDKKEEGWGFWLFLSSFGHYSCYNNSLSCFLSWFSEIIPKFLFWSVWHCGRCNMQ